MSKQFNLGRLFVELEASTKGLDGQLSQAERSFGRFTSFVTANPMVALASLGAAVGVAALKMASLAAAFEQSMTEVGTLVDKTKVNMENLADGTLALFRSMPVDNLKDLTTGLYNIVSAGIPAGDAIAYLQTATEAAIGGVTDVSTAVDGLTTATNAFESQGLTATDAADAMFTAVKLGKTTFGELSGSLGNVAGLANSLSISFDDLLANTAALTLGGLGTSESMNALRQVLSNVAKPTAELKKAYPDLAKEFDLTALKTKGLTGFMQDLAGRIGNNTDAAVKMFGSVEALNAVLTLTANDGAKVAQITEAMANKAGAAKQAYDEMSGTTENLHKILKNQFTSVLIELGQVVLPAVNLAMQATIGIMQGVLSLIDLIKNKGNPLAGFIMGPTEIENMQKMLALPIFGGKPIDLTNLKAGSTEFRQLSSAIASIGTATERGYLPAFKASDEALVAMRGTVEAYAKAHVRSLDATAPATERLAARYLMMLRTIDTILAQRKKNPDGPPPLDAATEEAAKERARALETIQKLSNESALSLATAQQRTFLDVTGRFNDQIAKLTGDDRTKAEAALKTAQNNLLQRWAGFNTELTPKVTHGTTLVVDNTKLQGMAMDDLGGDLDRLNVSTGRYTAEQVEAARKTKAWRDELLNVSGEITGTARKLQGLAHDLEPVFGSAFVDQIDAAVAAISDMGTAVARIASGDILGGVTQGVGALVSLGKTIFGSSDGLKKALSDNNARLKELRSTMGDLINIQQSGREIVGIQTALQRLLPTTKGKLDSGERQRLDLELLKVGLDRQALNDMAAALGIRIRDDNGDLQTDLLRNLLNAIRDLDTEWAQTFRGQRDRISQGVSVGAITDELGEAVRLATDSTLGSRAISTALAGRDLSTEAGRSDAIAALQELFANIGSLSVGDLGGLNRAEFTDAIQWLVDLLKASSEAAATTPAPSSNTPAPDPAPVPEPVAPTETAPGALDPWNELIDVSSITNDYLDQLLAEVQSFKAVAPPSLASIVPLASRTAAGLGGVSVTLTGDINTTLPAGTSPSDAQTLAAELSEAIVERIDEALARRAADAALLRGNAGRA